jgi:hypothetical protein
MRLADLTGDGRAELVIEIRDDYGKWYRRIMPFGESGWTWECSSTIRTPTPRHSHAVDAREHERLGIKGWNTITDWSGFERPHRGWGRESMNAFPDPEYQGPCQVGVPCRIFDYSLRSSAPYAGDLIASPLSGDATHDFAGSEFLVGAVELIDDAIGDDDALCESNETCLFSPNAGSYQGHGELVSVPFTAGAVENVTLVGFTENGY